MRKDLSGNKIGEWTVLRYVGGGKWECECSCGNKKNILTGKLTTRQTLSCGHAKTIDIKGDKYGEWTVLEYRGKGFWLCRCSCGVEKEVSSRHLRNGVSTSCGHGGSIKRIDLTGKVFGEYEVLKYAGNKAWLCKCSCGKIKEIQGYRLRNGEVTSCGHTNKIKSLVGNKYGLLEVLEYTGYGNYKCKCDCGETKEILATNLRNGSTISCGCDRKSIYTKEYIINTIEDYIKENNRLPCRADLAAIFDIHISYLSSLIKQYELNNKINTNFASIQEEEIYNTIKSIDASLEITINSRSILPNGKEIDIYIPKLKLAIEVNGVYWHRADILYKEYHQEKTVECAKLGIQLIHIFDYEWKDDRLRNKIIDIIKSKVDSNNMNKLYARKCTIKLLTSNIEKEFTEENHLSGYSSSKKAYGLYNGDELISVMTFGEPRFNNNYEWELIRYCNKPGIIIVGGAEKLFKHFIRENKPKSVISYCNISKFSGNVYSKLGFKATVSDITEPNYKWVRQNAKDSTDVLSRYQTQKAKLLSMGYGEYGDTEDSIMSNLGYYKVYDSGNLRFTWR